MIIIKLNLKNENSFKNLKPVDLYLFCFYFLDYFIFRKQSELHILHTVKPARSRRFVLQVTTVKSPALELNLAMVGRSWTAKMGGIYSAIHGTGDLLRNTVIWQSGRGDMDVAELMRFSVIIFQGRAWGIGCIFFFRTLISSILLRK